MTPSRRTLLSSSADFRCSSCLPQKPQQPTTNAMGNHRAKRVTGYREPGRISPDCGPAVVTIIVAVPPGLTDKGEREQRRPADCGAEQVSDTSPLKPLC